MKKLGKFIFGTLSIATVAAGAYYLYKNVINKDSTDDFDDFEDDFEDIDSEEEQPEKEMREYVSINISTAEEKKDEEEQETLEE